MTKDNIINSLVRSGRILPRPVMALCLAAAIFLWGGAAGAAGDQADRDGTEAGHSAEQADEPTAKESGDREVAPKLSFTDEDLKKYQRPKPGAGGEEDAAVLPGIEEEGKVARPAAPQGAPLVRTPLEVAKPPADDPLKEFKAREAREQFRAQQVATLRDRIAGLEKRIAYLRQKRLAIVDPLRIMPQPQSPDESAKEAGLGSAELLAAVEAEIESTEAALNGARDSLVAIETRFGAEGR